MKCGWVDGEPPTQPEKHSIVLRNDQHIVVAITSVGLAHEAQPS
jgi:hypothetical protein